VILRLESALIGLENDCIGLDSVCSGRETDCRDSESDYGSHEISCRFSIRGMVQAVRVIIEALKKMP